LAIGTRRRLIKFRKAVAQHRIRMARSALSVLEWNCFYFRSSRLATAKVLPSGAGRPASVRGDAMVKSLLRVHYVPARKQCHSLRSGRELEGESFAGFQTIALQRMILRPSTT